MEVAASSSQVLSLLQEKNLSPPPAQGPFHRTQSSTKSSNVCPSHRHQVSTNCNVGHFHRVQSFRHSQHESSTGSYQEICSSTSSSLHGSIAPSSFSQKPLCSLPTTKIWPYPTHSHWRNLWRTACCRSGPMLEKSMRNLLPKEEGVAETTYYEMTAIPILIPVKHWRNNLGVRLSP